MPDPELFFPAGSVAPSGPPLYSTAYEIDDSHVYTFVGHGNVEGDGNYLREEIGNIWSIIDGKEENQSLNTRALPLYKTENLNGIEVFRANSRSRYIKAVEINPCTVRVLEPTLAVPNYLIPVRLYSELNLPGGDLFWNTLFRGGQIGEGNYTSLLPSDAVYYNTMFKYSIPYTILEMKKTGISSTTAEPTNVGYEYNAYLHRYESSVSNKKSELLIPNYYMFKYIKGANASYKQYATLEKKVSLDILRNDLFKNRTRSFSYLEKDFSGYSFSPTLEDEVTNSQKNILFDDKYYEKERYDTTQPMPQNLFPYGVRISMPNDSGIIEKTSKSKYRIRDSIMKNDFSSKFLEILKDVYDESFPDIAPGYLEYTVQKSSLAKSSTPRMGPQKVETNTVNKTPYKTIDFLEFLTLIYNNYSASLNDDYSFVGNARAAAAERSTTYSATGFDRYFNNKNVMAVLNDTIKYSKTILNADDLKYMNLQNVINIQENPVETLAYRIEKVAGQQSENSTNKTVLQNFWMFNSSHMKNLDLFDTQVKYGEKYTYNCYAYVVVPSYRYKYTNLRLTKQIARIDTDGDGIPDQYCMQFYDPATNNYAEQLFYDGAGMVSSAPGSSIGAVDFESGPTGMITSPESAMPVSDGEGVDPWPPTTVEPMSYQGQDKPVSDEDKKKLEDAIDSAGDGLGPEGTNTPGGEQAASQGAMGGNSSPFEFYTGPVVAVTPGLKSGFGLGWVNSDIGYTPEGSPDDDGPGKDSDGSGSDVTDEEYSEWDYEEAELSADIEEAEAQNEAEPYPFETPWEYNEEITIYADRTPAAPSGPGVTPGTGTQGGGGTGGSGTGGIAKKLWEYGIKTGKEKIIETITPKNVALKIIKNVFGSPEPGQGYALSIEEQARRWSGGDPGLSATLGPVGGVSDSFGFTATWTYSVAPPDIPGLPGHFVQRQGAITPRSPVASPWTQGGESGGGSRSIVRSTTTRPIRDPYGSSPYSNIQAMSSTGYSAPAGTTGGSPFPGSSMPAGGPAFYETPPDYTAPDPSTFGPGTTSGGTTGTITVPYSPVMPPITILTSCKTSILATRNAYATIQQDMSDSPHVADFYFHVEPCFKVIEIPMFSKTQQVLDHPGNGASIYPFQYIDDSQRVGFETSYESHVPKEFPTVITAEDQVKKDDYLFANNLLLKDIINAKTISRARYVEVFRTSVKPTSYGDFEGNLLSTLDLRIEDTEYVFADTVYESEIDTNKKYYYLFRFLNEHMMISHPSEIMECELVNDGGYKYAIFGVLYEQHLRTAPPKNTTISMKKLLQIQPNMSQITLDTTDVDFNKKAATQINKVNVGVAKELIWGKRFKIRMISKKTGKKVDLNIKFKMQEDPEAPVKSAPPGMSVAPEPSPGARWEHETEVTVTIEEEEEWWDDLGDTDAYREGTDVPEEGYGGDGELYPPVTMEPEPVWPWPTPGMDSSDGPSFYEAGPHLPYWSLGPSTYDGSSDGPSFYEAGPYTGPDDTFTGAEMTYYEWDHDWE